MGLVLGLTGQFASGKSTAAQFFVDKGFLEIDLDLLGKQALQELRKEIVGIFGKGILDSQEQISPQKLGEIVFENEGQLQLLNQIVHPWMFVEAQRLIAQNPSKNILLNAALLIQMKLDQLCEKILYIQVSDEILIKRGIERNRFSREKLQGILQIQRAKNTYREKADYILENNKGIAQFQAQLNKLFNKILLNIKSML